MTDAERQAAKRRRTGAGYVYLGKFIRKPDLEIVEPYTLTAEEVDLAIQAGTVVKQEERE